MTNVREKDIEGRRKGRGQRKRKRKRRKEAHKNSGKKKATQQGRRTDRQGP